MSLLRCQLRHIAVSLFPLEDHRRGKKSYIYYQTRVYIFGTSLGPPARYRLPQAGKRGYRGTRGACFEIREPGVPRLYRAKNEREREGER